jgi:hypothetical protein
VNRSRVAGLTLLSVFVILVSGRAFAQEDRQIKCNKKLTECFINAPELVFGDHIAILDDRKMWVATGSVDEIEKGKWRKVIIIKSFSPVKKGANFVLISAKEANDPPEVKITRPLTFKQQGGSFGILTAAVGKDGAGFELSGFYQFLRNGFPLLIRLDAVSLAGEVSRGDQIYDIYVNGLGAMGGTSLYIWMTPKMALRTEIAVGFMWATVDMTGGYPGSKSSAARFKDGLDIASRGSLGLFYDFGSWQGTLEAAPQVLHQAAGFSIALGFTNILK